MLLTIPHGQLVDGDRPQCEASGVRQSFRRHLPLHVEDAIELPIVVLDTYRTQFVDNASYLNPIVGMRIVPILRRHEDALSLRAQDAWTGPHDVARIPSVRAVK